MARSPLEDGMFAVGFVIAVDKAAPPWSPSRFRGPWGDRIPWAPTSDDPESRPHQNEQLCQPRRADGSTQLDDA